MKRLGEKVKHGLCLGAGTEHVQPTSNARNMAMESEVRRFAQSLKQLHAMLIGLDKSCQGGLTTVKSVLMTPLPHAFDEQPTGMLLQMDPEDRILGLNVNLDNLQASGSEMHVRLHNEVLLPLEQWLQEYRNTKTQNRKCEALRLDLDDKRRATLALNDKYKKHAVTQHKDTDATYAKLQTEEDKLTRLAQAYGEKEAEVFNSYLRLIRDSAALRDYAALGLAILQRCLTSAYGSFDLSTPTRPPLLPQLAAVPQITYAPTDGGATSPMSGAASPVPVTCHVTRPLAITGGGAALPPAKGLSDAGGYMPQAPPSPNGDRLSPAGTPTGTPPLYTSHLAVANEPPPRPSAATTPWYAEHLGKAKGASMPPPPGYTNTYSDYSSSRTEGADMPSPPLSPRLRGSDAGFPREEAPLPSYLGAGDSDSPPVPSYMAGGDAAPYTEPSFAGAGGIDAMPPLPEEVTGARDGERHHHHHHRHEK